MRFGIVVFAWDSEFYNISKLTGVKSVRYITNKGFTDKDSNFDVSCSHINFLLSIEKNVLLNIPDISLAGQFFQRFGTRILYQFKNEPNGGPDGYVNPDTYIKEFKQFEQTVNGNAVMSGLNCEITKNSKKGMIAKDYFKKLIPQGIKEATKAFVLHTYGNKNQYNNILGYMRKFAPDKPIIIGEYGLDSCNSDLKIKSLDAYIEQFKKDNVSTAMLYAWQNGNSWGIYNQPEVINWYNAK